MSNSRILATIVSAGGVLADGVINAAEIGNITLPNGGDIVGTTSTQTIAGKTIAFASNTLTGVQPSLVSGTNVKTINNGSLLGSGDVAVQPTLVSGTNVKTVNSTSLLGSGDVAVQPTLVSGTNVKTVNSTSLLGSGNINVGDVTLDGTQTLINKTLTSPVIATPTGLVKADVNLGNVDNTSDATKNSAVATLINKTLQASNITEVLTLSGTAGIAGQVLTTQGAGNAPTWTSSGASYASLLKFE